jgi:alpha-glucosidase
VFLRYTRLHYRLIPYIYSQMWEQHTTGIGPIRPLPLEFQDDPQTYSISNQYFYGKNLMVSFDHSNIYLPKGKWTYYWDGRTFEGGKTLTSFGAPADELPVFVREGAIIPMMPDMNWVGEKPIDPLIIDIYPEGTSTFTLFEDDGISFNYEKGDYCETGYQVVRNKENVIVDISARKAPGSYIPPSRNYLLTIHNGVQPSAVTRDGKALIKKGSEAELNSSADSWYYSDGITMIRFADTGKKMKVTLIN